MLATPPAPSPDNLQIERIEAAREDWRVTRAPETGWQPVTLPDAWTTRWPAFDGVTWYRLTWRQRTDGAPLSALIDYANMASAVYFNGVLLGDDPNLVEPLTRGWNTPRYLRLPVPLLRTGTNTLLIRVSGLAAYQPGLGMVTVGDPGKLREAYDLARFLRHDMQLFGLAITTTLGCFFLTLWAMRRQEAAYGWFSLTSLAWMVYPLNQVITSTGPFRSTDQWQTFTSIALLLYCGCFTMFILRFSQRRLPRVETALWALIAVSSVIAVVTPHGLMGPMRAQLTLLCALIYFTTCLLYLRFALRSGRLDHYILASAVVTFLAAALHDLLTFLEVVDGNFYYAAMSSPLLMIGMAFVLAWQFVASLRRIERFNAELSETVAQARGELAGTLHRQHQLELANTRLNERLNLAHDLHDGLGGTLVSSIATLEHAPQSIPPERFLVILKELRDDLRIVIDAAASQQFGGTSLPDLIAPLRHRFTRLFEMQNVECVWRITGTVDKPLPAAVALDILRMLQEALTNVFRHSGASAVDVEVRNLDDAIELVVTDNGTGLEPARLAPDSGSATAATGTGTGMRSMQSRVSRLGGTFSIRSTGMSTSLRIRVPCAPASIPGESRRSP